MKIINFGSMNVDYVYRVDRFLLPGETRPAKSRSVHAGGKGLNQSIALARAGAQVYQAGILGSDGTLLLDALKESGVHTDYLGNVEESGGHTVIQVDDGGENSILVYGGTNQALTREYIDKVLGYFSSDDIVLLQNETNLVDYIIEKASSLGLRVAFNAAPIDIATISYPLGKTSWLIVNEVEGEALTGETAASEILSSLAVKYPDTAMLITLGADGCRYRKGDASFSLRAYNVPYIADTTGAGDTFIGYFLRAITQGSEVLDALKRASMASALSVQKNGAAASIPLAHEVDAALSAANA